MAARPNSGQALHLLGQARLKLGRFAEAREPLERAAKFLPKEVAAQVNYAGCLTVLGEHEASLWAFDRAAKLKPGDPVIAHNKGRALEALGRLEEAERSYDDALAADHRLMPSLIARAGLLEARGDWMGALADLDMALVNRPDDARLRLRRGELLLQQGDWMRGLPDYEARLEIAGECYAPDLPRWQGEPVDGRLLIYPEQLDIESDAARRDTLMLARGVDAVVQCGETLAALLDGPTIRRGDPLAGFSAAAAVAQPALSAGLECRCAAAAASLARSRCGLAERSSRRPMVGDDTWETHLAACRGSQRRSACRAKPDWLWGKQDGPSPWYRSLELVR